MGVDGSLASTVVPPIHACSHRGVVVETWSHAPVVVPCGQLWRVPQLDFFAVVDALTAQGYGDDRLNELGAQLGFADSVTVEQLAAAGVPNRTVFDIRRRLDPRAVAAEVRSCVLVQG